MRAGRPPAADYLRVFDADGNGQGLGGDDAQLQSNGFTSGPTLPARFISRPITFTYGVPFRLVYRAEAFVRGIAGPLAGYASSARIHFHSLGMAGLPANAVVHSDSGVDWSRATP